MENITWQCGQPVPPHVHSDLRRNSERSVGMGRRPSRSAIASSNMLVDES
jgi:hypothetical protein